MQYLYIYKIKNRDVWEKWISELNKRKNEIHQTLENEKISQEWIFIHKKDDLVYYLIESENLKESIDIFNESTIAIDIEHKKITTECLEFINCIKADFFVKLSN